MTKTSYNDSQHRKETHPTIDSLGLIGFLTYDERKKDR